MYSINCNTRFCIKLLLATCKASEPVKHMRHHTRLLLLLTSVVWQIAGAAAAEGLSLQEVSEVARQAAQHCRSVGVATHICTLPGAQPSDR